jgi:LEA14-like dessication related protein
MHAMKISLKGKFDVGFMEKLVTFETKEKNMDKKTKQG